MKMEMCWDFSMNRCSFEVKGVLELIGPKTICYREVWAVLM